jgi:sugar phosphate isomerase/epimerase
MILDRVGVLSDEVSADLREALDWIAAQRLRRVEIRMVDGSNVVYLDDAAVARAAAEVRARGLSVTAIATPIFKCALDPSRPVASGDTFGAAEESVDVHLQRLPRAIAIARAFGTRALRIFSFWREREPQNHGREIVALLRRAGEIAAADGAMLLLENEPSCNGGSAAEAAALVRQVEMPHALRLLWDPGNEAYDGRPAFPDGYRRVRGLIGHVHLKDAARGPDGRFRFVPLGAGEAGIAAQLGALADDGYEGLFTIETHFSPEGGTRMDGTAQTLAGLRQLLAA